MYTKESLICGQYACNQELEGILKMHKLLQNRHKQDKFCFGSFASIAFKLNTTFVTVILTKPFNIPYELPCIVSEIII